MITKTVKHFDCWRGLGQYEDTRVFEMTRTVWWFWFIPIWMKRTYVWVPVWLKVRQLTLGY
jgi:hypothetical protein